MDTKMQQVVAAVALFAVIVVPFTKAEVDCNEHPNFVHPKECCPMPNLISEEIMEKCREQVGMPPPPPPGDMPEEDDDDAGSPPGRHHHHHGPHGHHGHHDCFASCLLNETKILIDGQLDENMMDIYLNDAIGDTPDAIPVLKESFQMCYEKSEEIMRKMREHFEKEGNGPPRKGRGPPHGRCPPQGVMIFHCAMMNSFKNCPDSIWTGTDECNEMRDYFSECMKPPQDNDDI